MWNIDAAKIFSHSALFCVSIWMWVLIWRAVLALAQIALDMMNLCGTY